MDNNKTKLGPNLIYVGWLWHDTDTVTLTGHSLPVLNTQVFILLTLPLAGQWLDTSQPGKWQGHLYCSHFILCTAEHRESVLLV